MKKILVPVDFSDCSDQALDEAIYVAGTIGAELHLYHVGDLHPNWASLSERDREAYRENLEKAGRIREQLEERRRRAADAGVNVQATFTHGHVIEQVVEYTQRFGMDLVVIGTHGMSGYRDWVIGSNTQKVLRQVDCPVLIIKQKPADPHFRKMAFVSDFQESHRDAFARALDAAEWFKAEVWLINMDEPGYFHDPAMLLLESMRDFQEEALSRGLDCHVLRLTSGSLEEGLRQAIAEKGIDLVILPTHGRGPLARLFLSSMAEAVANNLDVPVMTIRIGG